MEKNTHKNTGSRRAGYFWPAAWPAVAVVGVIAIPTAIAMAIFSQSAIAATAPGRSRDGQQLRGPGRVYLSPTPTRASSAGTSASSPGTAVTGFPSRHR